MGTGEIVGQWGERIWRRKDVVGRGAGGNLEVAGKSQATKFLPPVASPAPAAQSFTPTHHRQISSLQMAHVIFQ